MTAHIIGYMIVAPAFIFGPCIAAIKFIPRPEDSREDN